MSGGGFRGRSFGQHGARYNNSRSRGRDDAGGNSGRSRGDKERNSRSYSRENFDGSTSTSRRSSQSQNENWSGPRTFTRWDQASINRQPSPSSSSTHNQTAWLRNRNEHYQINGSLRFQYRNDSHQHYNRGGRGYFSRGDYRFSNQRGSQNFFSPYYSAPFRENSYEQQEKEPPSEEPTVPLLGSEEERQQKITEAADELKRKLLSTATNDDIEANSWKDSTTLSHSSHHNDKSDITKSSSVSRHDSPELHTIPNNQQNSGALNEEHTIFPIKLIDCMQEDNGAELGATTPTHDNILSGETDDTSLIVIPTSKEVMSDGGDHIIDKQIPNTHCTVEALHNPVDPDIHGIRESFNELATESSNQIVQRVEGGKNYSANDEPAHTMIADDSCNFTVAIVAPSNSIDIMNAEVPDLTVTNSSIMELSNVSDSNQMPFDITASSEDPTLQVPFLTYPTVHNLKKKKELNLIEYLQKQVGLSKSKSSHLSLVEREKTGSTSELNNESVKNTELFSSSSNHSQDNNSHYGGSTVINHDYSELDILQPPPLPPTLPPPSYESPESCLNAIVPEFDSIIRPLNDSSPCETFHQTATFNTQHTAISPIMSTAPVVNSSMNIATPMSSYAVGHQNYVPLTSYGPGVSLAYPSIIPSLDYATSQAVVPPPLTSSNSSSIRSLILQDVCATNVNDDDDVLYELKEAMEFAKQCMVMGNDDNGPEEEDIEFPTFPDLPPVMPVTLPTETLRGVKKNSQIKKMKRGMLGAQLKALAEAKNTNISSNIVTASIEDGISDNPKTDFANRRKVMFNLNSRCRILNKNDSVWLDESPKESQALPRSEWPRSTLLPVIESQINKNEKFKRDPRANKTKEPEPYKESEQTKETEKVKEPGRTKNLERTKEAEGNRVSVKTKEFSKSKVSETSKVPGKLLMRGDKSDKNSHRKSTDISRTCDKNQREPKKNPDKPPPMIDDAVRNDQHSSPTRLRKAEKTNSDGIISISDQSCDTQAQIAHPNKSSKKTTAPKLVTESTWKDRVIGRFLKMSKNDIQNMINNSSLRKFDIAMQHLVKEKKSSLSLEMRNHEDEKMKTSTYDNEDFMTQLQAILDPAATVDITDLPTNFIHQLSAVLHLDSSPTIEEFSINNSGKNVGSVEPSTSTSTKIDAKITNESSHFVGTNTPVIGTHDMSKSQKIDNRVSRDTVKHTSGTVPAAATCIRTKVKRGQIDNANVQHNTSQVSVSSAPSLSLSRDDDDLDVDELDELIEAGVAPAKTTKTSSDDIKSMTPPLPVNKTPTVVIERILLTDTATPPTETTIITTTAKDTTAATIPAITTTTTTTITTATAAAVSTSPRMKTLDGTRMGRRAMESENFFIAGVPKSEFASSPIRTIVVDSAVDEAANETRTRKSLRHGVTHSNMSENMWRRKDADDVDVCRNMTKEEYEAHYGEPVPHTSDDAVCRKIATSRSQKIGVNGREVICHSEPIDGAIYESHPQPCVPSQNLPNQIEIGDAGSDSQCNSDTSTSSSSGSNSDVEPSLLDVTKVLKFIKQREKIAKRKTINEEIRDEVAAEIEKRRKEKSIKHRSHKSRSKKRDKRKKEKKGKKKKVRKKKRRKTHHLSHSGDDTIEKEELPLRLLANDEIKREVQYDEQQKTVAEVSRHTVQPRRPTVTSTKSPDASVNSTMINKSERSKPTTSVMTTIVPTISSTPALITSAFKPNPIMNSPSLIVTVVNTSIANANTSVSSVVKAALTSTATSPLRTVTAISIPCSTTPQSPIPQPKTKAQLKQMPEAIKATQNIDTKSIESPLIEPKIVEPVSSTSGSQIIAEPRTPPSKNTLSVSTMSVTTSQTGPKKLDIKAYQQRALQRKLREEEKMKNLVANPTQLTHNLLKLPIKKPPPPPVDDLPRCSDASEILSANIESNSVDQPDTGATTTPLTATGNQKTKKPKRIHSKLTNIQSKGNIDELHATPFSKTALSQTRREIDQPSATNLFDTNFPVSDMRKIENKFINIKSEGGKELKLREKVKKRPQKVVAPLTTASIHIDAGTIEKVTPTARNRRKNLSPSLETNENIRGRIKTVTNIEVAIDKLLSTVNLPTGDARDNHEDKNPTENIETDVVGIVQMMSETNEHSLQINDSVMDGGKSSETIESTRTPGHINFEQTSNSQTAPMSKEFDITETLGVISSFSHYFRVTEGLISDGLPDTVALEEMAIKITPQVQKIVETDNTHVISSKSTHPDDDRISTSECVFAVDSLRISPKLIENIPVNSDDLSKNLNTGDNFPEVLEQPVGVSDIFDNEYDDAPSLPSTSMVSEADIHSLLTVSTATTELINSRESITVVSESTPTDLLESSELSHVDTTISSTYPLFHVERDKPQSYDQLTLDDLSDISMDGSTLSDQKEVSQASVSKTLLLSEQENNVVNLLGKDTILMATGKEDGELTTVGDEVDNWDGSTHHAEDNLIPNRSDDELPQSNGISISDHVSPPDDCYKEYSQQSVVLHDRVLSMEDPRNSFLDDPITFSNTKSPTPEPIEYGVLGDDDVMAESIYDNHQLEETSQNNTLSDVIPTSDAFVQNEEVSDCFANENPCLSKSPSMSTPLSLNENIVHSSSIHDRELIKVVEGTSPERLPSPILEISSNSNEGEENGDSNGDINEVVEANDVGISNNNTKVDANENQDHRSENETIGNNTESVKEDRTTTENVKLFETPDCGVDDPSTNQLLNNSNQHVIESPTSTTRIIEANSSGRDESERSSSEARSIEQERTQHEIPFTSGTTQEKSRHKRRDRDHYSSRKCSSSKSLTSTLDHKKHKKHDHDRNKHKLTLERVEEAIAANITNLVSKPTTKDDVMSRMQEIDIAIQRLMNEKMQLYRMLQTDEWPVNQDVGTLNELSITKTQLHPPSKQSDKISKAKEARVMVSRLTEIANIKQSSATETLTPKPQNSNIQKPETLKIKKQAVTTDEKRTRKLDGKSCKISNKRKYLFDQKDLEKSKQSKREESPITKKQCSSYELSRHKKNSPFRLKNSESGHRKPVKLSQMLAREFKPKVNVEMQRSVSPTGEDEEIVPKSHIENEDKITHSMSMESSKSSSSDHESSDEIDSSHFIQPRIISPHTNQNDAIYSDESSWDVTDQCTSRLERSTGLSLLEQSIKREMVARRSKLTELKTKSPTKNSKDESPIAANADTESILSSRPAYKRKPQRKKHQQNPISQSPNETNKHVLEVIDAVAKNRINDLYANLATPEKKQKTSKKSEKLSKSDKKESDVSSETQVDESEAPLKKTKSGNNLIKRTAEFGSTIPIMNFIQSASPRSVSESLDEYRNEANTHDSHECTRTDSIQYFDRKDDDDLTRCNDRSEKSIEQTKNIREASLDVTGNAKQALQTVASASQQHPDVRHNDNMETISPKCGNTIQNEKDDMERSDVRREILNDWQNSPNVSHHELDYPHDEDQKTVSTAEEKTANETIPLSLASTIVNSDIASEYHAVPVIEKSVIVESTPMTMINQHDYRNSGKDELDDDSISEKLVIENSVTDLLPVNVRESKSNQSKSVEDFVTPATTTGDFDVSKLNVEKLESPKLAVEEIERPKSTIKELERSKSSGKKNGRPKPTSKELGRLKLTTVPSTATVKNVDRPKSTLKELEKSKLVVTETERPKSTVDDLNSLNLTEQELIRSKSVVKESERFKLTAELDDKSKVMAKGSGKLKSTSKDQERPKSTVKELERSKVTVKEPDKPKSTVKEVDKSKSPEKEYGRAKSIVDEIARSKSGVKENDRPKSTVKDLDRPKSAVKELGRSTSTMKELDRSKSAAQEFEQSKSMRKDLDRFKSTVKGMEDRESSDHKSDEDDDDGDELMRKKRDEQPKRRRQTSSRRSSRQSDDSFRATSGSKSPHKRITKSPSSRDRSTSDVEQSARPNSGSSSSSKNSRNRWNISSNIDINTNDRNITVRRGRKRKITIERTREQMANCKVRLVDCRNLYLQSNSRSDILQRLGIMRINTWTPTMRREPTPEQSATRESSIMVDEDRNRSDDESMEIIQVDDSMDLQSITSPGSSADIMIRDPLAMTPRPSPQYSLSPRSNDTTVMVDVANENGDGEDASASSDYVEVLETRTATPVNNLLPSDRNNDDELQTMQYTVHKGPILDIKVFGDSFLAASEDGSIYRYCQRSNGILNIYKGHEAAVTCLYVHEVPGTADSGNIRWNLFSGSLDATLRCYDIINGSLDRHIADVASPIQCMDHAWGMIFVGTKSGHISRYDIKSGCLRDDNLDFSDKPVLALRASTEGARRVLIVASRNQPITIRDAQNGLYLRTISGQRTHTVYSLMRDRNLVYCGTSSTSIPVFDFISGEQVIQYTAGVGIVCMRLYRQLLFAGCYDGNIYVFDTKDTKLICSIPGPGNMLLSMEIVGDKIIAGSKDRRLHSWRMPIQARTILAERA